MMSHRPLHRTVVVTDPIGVHTRVAVVVAEIVRQSRSRVKLWVDPAYRVEGTEVIQILSLAAPCGTKIHLEATGPDAEAVLKDLETVFADFEKVKSPKTGQGRPPRKGKVKKNEG